MQHSIKEVYWRGKRTVPMVTYTILHEFTTCDPCHVPNKVIMIIFDISYFQEEQKNEYYLFWINISCDKNTLLSNTYIYILDLNRRKAGFIKFSVKHGGNTALIMTKNDGDICGKCNSSLTLSRQNCGE